MKLPAILAATVAVLLTVTGAGAIAGALTRPADPPPHPALVALTVAVPAAPPLDNDASAGTVTFTFDDGPDAYTPALLRELTRLHVPAVFFVFGWKALAHPQIIRAEIAAGDRIENHTWDHLSFTGASTGTPPLSAAKIRAELNATQRALISLGVPAPAYYRPPFGDISASDDAIAASLGLEIIQPFSVTAHGTVTDSRDWTGISAARIVADVTRGYTVTQDGVTSRRAGIRGGSVIGFHDSSPGDCTPRGLLCANVRQVILALPGIIAWMNRHHLGATALLPGRETGGINLAPGR